VENQQWCSVGGASRFCGVVFFGVTVTIYLRVYTYTQMTHTHINNLHMRNGLLSSYPRL
jgi:hypothetical protein